MFWLRRLSLPFEWGVKEDMEVDPKSSDTVCGPVEGGGGEPLAGVLVTSIL